MFQPRTIRDFALLAALCAAFSLTTELATAAPLIDVGVGNSTAAGAGVIGAAGDQWNQLGGGNQSASNLIDTTGAHTAVAVSIAADGGGGGFANTSPNTSITQSYDWTNSSNPVSVSLSGLQHNQPYNLFLYSVTDPCCNEGRPSTYTIAAANGGATGFVTDNTTLSSWVTGQNYIELTAKSTATGNISFQLAQTLGEADINGFQLQVSTPEPGSLLLMGLGAAGLLIMKRRMRAVQKRERRTNLATN